jgi:hypothetical protein
MRACTQKMWNRKAMWKERDVKANDDSFSFPAHPLFRLQSTVRLTRTEAAASDPRREYVNKTQIKNNDKRRKLDDEQLKLKQNKFWTFATNER